MKIIYDQGSWGSHPKPPSDLAAILFLVATKTLDKLEEGSSYVEVIKIGALQEQDTPSYFPMFGSIAWTCVININGKKLHVMLKRAALGNLIWEQDPGQNEGVCLCYSKHMILGYEKAYTEMTGFVERAVDEFVNMINEKAGQVALEAVSQLESVCQSFGRNVEVVDKTHWG